MLLIGLACSGGGGSDDSSFAGLLKVIPDTPESRKAVWMIDIAHVRAQFGIAILPSDADKKALSDYLVAIVDRGRSDQSGGQTGLAHAPFISGFGVYSISIRPNRQHDLAFDLRNVDQTVYVPRPFGPNRRTGSGQWTTGGMTPLEIVRGRFDPQATADALERCSECESPLLEERNGIAYYSWGDDNVTDPKKAYAPPAFDSIGRGGRVAVLDDYVLIPS